MKTYTITAILLLSLNLSAFNQEIGKIDADGLQTVLSIDDNRLHIVNFWATWCGPCVTEIPYFEKALSEADSTKIAFHFISLDFPSSFKETLIPYLKDRKISPYVLLMTDMRYNKWIPDIDENWKGNIPATLFYKRSDDTRHFHSGALNYEQLNELITKYQ